jgi:hypothetical protein
VEHLFVSLTSIDSDCSMIGLWACILIGLTSISIPGLGPIYPTEPAYEQTAVFASVLIAISCVLMANLIMTLSLYWEHHVYVETPLEDNAGTFGSPLGNMVMTAANHSARQGGGCYRWERIVGCLIAT